MREFRKEKMVMGSFIFFRTLITLVGIISLFSNLISFTGPYDFEKTFSKYQAQLEQISGKDSVSIRDLPSSAKPDLPKPETQHIAFLKVHKAASSTAQNIFLRFGWQRNLTFVLAPAKNPAGYPNIISLRESLTNSNILAPPPGRHFDILCNHVFYSYDSFKKFMPNDTAFIGIVREPFEHYKSILNYFRPRYIFAKIKGQNPGSIFLRNPDKYEPKGRVSASWTNSRQAIEFGFPDDVFREYNKTRVAAYLQRLSGEFPLVLVAEYMEESVIIMRRLLHWHTQDIMFLDQNVARRKNDSNLPRGYDRDFYKNYAKIDYDLYNFFYKRLMTKIRHEGADFDDELLAFKGLRKKTREYCNDKGIIQPMVVEETRWGPQFEVTKADCADMRRLEIDFITRIRIRQYGSKDI